MIKQLDVKAEKEKAKQEKITELPKLEKIGNLTIGSLRNGFGTINISSNISTTTKISAPTIEATGTGGTRGLSGEVITGTQNYIKKLPILKEVGSLTDGSLNNGFGPIEANVSFATARRQAFGARETASGRAALWLH